MPLGDEPLSVSALIRSVAERERFVSGLRRNIRPRFSTTPSEMLSHVAADGVDGVILGLESEAAEDLAPLAQSIERRFPSVAIVFYLQLDGDNLRGALSLASHAAPHDVIIQGVDDVSAVIMLAIAKARHAGATGRMVAMVDRVATQSLRDVLVFMAHNAERPMCVADVARYMGMSRRTLFNRFQEAGLPTVTRLLHWLRLLHVMALLESPRATVEQVADQLQFPSSSTLRHLIKRITGKTATEIRNSGGFTYLLGRAERLFSAARGEDDPQDDEVVSLDQLVSRSAERQYVARGDTGGRSRRIVAS